VIAGVATRRHRSLSSPSETQIDPDRGTNTMNSIGLQAYLLVAAVLFVCGILCMATKRNGVGVLMGVELVLNGANINLVAFSKFGQLGLDAQVMAMFVIVLAAAEAAVALAIVLNFYNNHFTIDVDRANELRG
jgi:NADH:ubiquinone oxidoreductase subunit K